MTSPSGAYMWGADARRDEEFHQVVTI